ncbi:hypothetical protein [uncultured Roseobacter sp.]|uniref:hypothetical protein n=1 Tax=uncultured Roseobacter sp. TaxID=114847 RepID=UPI00263673A5|nr:hypothetical protein [uncultured Roseobacter sp.]
MVGFNELNDSYGDDLGQGCVDFGVAIPGNDHDALRLELSEGGAAQIEISSWQVSGHRCSARMAEGGGGGWDFSGTSFSCA